MSLLSNLELLRRVPIFSALTESQSVALAGAVTKRRFKRGELIVEQGKQSRTLFVILSGRAHVVMIDQRDRSVILAVLEPGDYIGEISLFDGQSHSANVQAEVQTDVLTLSHTEFRHCLANHPTIADSIIQGLAQRLRQANGKISALALMNVYGRVAMLLVSFSEPAGDKQMLVRHKISRQDIAKMVGATREMVSRVMRDFEHQGFIKTLDDGSISIRERRSKPR